MQVLSPRSDMIHAIDNGDPLPWREAYKQIQSEVKYLKFCLEAEVESRGQAIADLAREVKPLAAASPTQEMTAPSIASKDAKPTFRAIVESKMWLLQDQITYVNTLATNLEKVIIDSVSKVLEEVKKNSLWVEEAWEKQNKDLEELRGIVHSETELCSRLDGDLQKLGQVVSKIEASATHLVEQSKVSGALSLDVSVSAPSQKYAAAASPKVSKAKILARSASCPPVSLNLGTVGSVALSLRSSPRTSLSRSTVMSPMSPRTVVDRCRSASPGPITARGLSPRRARTQFEVLPRLTSGVELKDDHVLALSILTEEFKKMTEEQTKDDSTSEGTQNLGESNSTKNFAITNAVNGPTSVYVPKLHVISSTSSDVTEAPLSASTTPSLIPAELGSSTPSLITSSTRTPSEPNPPMLSHAWTPTSPSIWNGMRSVSEMTSQTVGNSVLTPRTQIRKVFSVSSLGLTSTPRLISTATPRLSSRGRRVIAPRGEGHTHSISTQR